MIQLRHQGAPRRLPPLPNRDARDLDPFVGEVRAPLLAPRSHINMRHGPFSLPAEQFYRVVSFCYFLSHKGGAMHAREVWWLKLPFWWQRWLIGPRENDPSEQREIK